MMVHGMRRVMVLIIGRRSFKLEIILCLGLCHGMTIIKMAPKKNEMCICATTMKG